MMNMSFYLALDRLPMSLVAAMEFAGTMVLALIGMRSWRNLAAITLVIGGVGVLIDFTWSGDLIGLAWSALNASLFTLYIVLGHKLANGGASQGVELLGAAMSVAFIVFIPIGLFEAIKAFGAPVLIAAGVGVGVCSSVIPYVCDQLAMARLPRSSFALMLALLPAMATLIGAIVLKQIPSSTDLLGIGLVVIGVAIHVPPKSDNQTGNIG
jgi:inner membrane transporter RhtA